MLFPSGSCCPLPSVCDYNFVFNIWKTAENGGFSFFLTLALSFCLKNLHIYSFYA